MIAQSEIQLLRPEVADAIAAGEVVERPAAVIKELCENAIDAGATKIEVELEGGGITRIVVSDDGSGIASDQLRLAVTRHATSKISRVQDLTEIATLGFRGEALASIAAVSELRVCSRTSNAASGSEIVVLDGREISFGAAATGPGTIVEVCDLFAATPARLAFLRSAQTEAATAVRVVADLALCRPDIAFKCVNDGRTAVRTTSGTLRDAIAAIFGESVAAEMLEIDPDSSTGVLGWLSEPRRHRSDRNQIVLIVNGRRVHNRALMVAVEDAYRGLLPVNRHPYAVLHIGVEHPEVDVNVHPTKREVKFRNERAVFSMVQRACWAALQNSRLIPTSIGNATVATQPHEYQPALTETSLLVKSPAVPWITQRGVEATTAVPGKHTIPGEQQDAERLSQLAPLRALGQVENGWICASSATGIVVIDPHAAHEKVLYLELVVAAQAAEDGGKPLSQLLLIPTVVQMDVAAAAIVDAPWLKNLGFELEAMGPGMVRCAAVPAAVANTDPEKLIVDVLSSRGSGGESDTLRIHRIAALSACHAAVKLGERISVIEQQRILDRLVITPGGMTCPHGRPTVMVLDNDALRRAFHRP